MTSRRTLIENLASSILAANGIGAIWQLHIDAAHAYRTGYPTAALAILELAEVSEGVWLQRAEMPAPIGDWL